MTLVDFSEIIFNFTGTIVLILVGCVVYVVGYELIKFINEIKNLVEKMKRNVVNAYENLFFVRGELKSSSGKKVKNRKQAIAIGLSESRESGAKVPPPLNK